jgi:hypothetical protein
MAQGAGHRDIIETFLLGPFIQGGYGIPARFEVVIVEINLLRLHEIERGG